MEFEIVDQDSGKAHSSIVKVAFYFRPPVYSISGFRLTGWLSAHDVPGSGKYWPILIGQYRSCDINTVLSLVQTRPDLWHEREYWEEDMSSWLPAWRLHPLSPGTKILLWQNLNFWEDDLFSLTFPSSSTLVFTTLTLSRSLPPSSLTF